LEEARVTALATTTLDEVAGKRWDAVVIGAGPAGALAARGLAQRQAEILLVERKCFPRGKVCGSCISLRALLLLEHAGLGPTIEALHGLPLTNAKIIARSRAVRISLPGGVSISRNELDEALVKAAIIEGAEFLPQVTASVSPEVGSEKTLTRVVELSDSQGGRFPVETSVIVAADGLGHPSLRKCREFAERIQPHSRIGLGATILAAPSGFEPGSVSMAVGKTGYVGAVRLRDGRLHLAASVDQETMRFGHSPADVVSEIFQDCHLPGIPELSHADWQGTLPLTRRTDPVAARRIFLIGDAAGYVEPFTGEGIAWALAAGLAAPRFVRPAASNILSPFSIRFSCRSRSMISWRGVLKARPNVTGARISPASMANLKRDRTRMISFLSATAFRVLASV
jgi:flavin-dependent dehydrogenase